MSFLHHWPEIEQNIFMGALSGRTKIRNDVSKMLQIAAVLQWEYRKILSATTIVEIGMPIP